MRQLVRREDFGEKNNNRRLKGIFMLHAVSDVKPLPSPSMGLQ